MENVTAFVLSQEFFEKFREAVREHDAQFVRESLRDVRHEDISKLLEGFDAEDSKFVISLLDKRVGAQIIRELDEDIRPRFLSSFSSEEIADFIELVETDDAADILNELPVKRREEVIISLEDEEKADYIIELLRYDEDCAGGLMAKELVKAQLNWDVDECIAEIRRQAQHVRKIFSVYVVDEDGHLAGRVSLKRILLAEPKTRVADIYEKDVEAVYTFQKEEEVAEMMQRYDLEAIPVVNVQDKLVGRITVDDVLDVITELAEQERNLMAGISEDVVERDSIFRLSRARLPWLVIGLVGGFVGARFIGIFEEDLAKVTALAFFIPLIMATGGNVGIQSSALVVQSLASAPAFADNTWKKFFKTLAVALLNGVVLAGLVYLFIYFTNEDTLAFVVSIALFSVVLLASMLGTIIPLVLSKVGFNPALASGPFITTTIDLLGLAVYFMVAHMLFNF